MLVIVTLICGMGLALYCAVLWACVKSESLVAEILIVALAFASILYFNIPTPWLQTPGEFIRNSGIMTEQWQLWTFGLGTIILALVGFYVLKRIGFILGLAKKLSKK